MKCRYKNCLCEEKEIPKGEEVLFNKLYYHKSCLETKNNIQEIARVFSEKINENVVFPQLYRVVNNIVFDKKVDSECLLFGLNYYVEHKIPLNYPQGLYYVIQNKEMLAAYNKMKANEIKKEMDKVLDSVDISEENEMSFTYKPSKQKGFGDILGGK